MSCVDANTGELVRFSNQLPPNRPPENFRRTDLTVDHLMRNAMVEDIDHAQTVNELVRANPEATYHVEVELDQPA